MSQHKSLLTFALNDCGAVVSIEHVDRGAACGCFCPACGERLIAKQGDVKIWHFAHALGADCAHGTETALHKAAKQIILETHELLLPSISITAQALGKYSGRLYFAETSLPERLQHFDRIQLEQPIGGIIPDILGQVGELKILIEIAVTHPVGDDKLMTIKQLGFPAIEISLDLEKHTGWNWKKLSDEVLRNTENRHWLHHPQVAALKEEALTKAQELANAEEPLPERKPVKTYPKIKLSFKGKPVRLTEYPFGLVAWSPYDPEINQILKRFGGRWQPERRNWILSNRVKDVLIMAFC